MARTDFHTPRLCVGAPLAEGETVTPTSEQTHYLVNVLRLREGARVLVFNGRGWRIRRSVGAIVPQRGVAGVGERLRPQENPPDVDYLFAPLKHARLDYVARRRSRWARGV